MRPKQTAGVVERLLFGRFPWRTWTWGSVPLRSVNTLLASLAPGYAMSPLPRLIQAAPEMDARHIGEIFTGNILKNLNLRRNSQSRVRCATLSFSSNKARYPYAQ